MAERHREMKFSDSELQMLTDRSAETLPQNCKSDVSLYQREEPPVRVGASQSGSAVGVFKRSPTDCKRRWFSMKRRTKENRPVIILTLILILLIIIILTNSDVCRIKQILVLEINTLGNTPGITMSPESLTGGRHRF